MRATFAASMLLSAAILAGNSVQARDFDQYGGSNGHRIFMGPSKSAAPAPRPLATMDLTPKKPLHRPYDDLSMQPSADRFPTAVSYRVGNDGPVGSVGLIDMGGDHMLDRSLMSNAVANQPGAPSQTLGASLASEFR